MDVFVDVENRPFETAEADGNIYSNFGSVAVGNGSQVFRADQSGIWLGASEFVDAPFSVDMAGNLIASSADFSGTGYTKTVTFAQDAIPTSGAIGDLWVDTNDNNKMYRAASVGATTIAAGQWEEVDQDTYKLDKVGGTYTTTSTAAAAKVQILPSADIGLIAYTTDGTTVVFKVEVGGANVGDVTIGNYAGGSGVLWDQSAGIMRIKGNMTAGSIDGVAITGGTVIGTTFKTAASGVRIEMTAADAKLSLYDSTGDEAGSLDDYGGYIMLKALDSRNLTFDSDGGNIYLDQKTWVNAVLDMRDHDIENVTGLSNSGSTITLKDDVHISSSQNLVFDGTQGSINCGAIDCDAIAMNGNALTGVTNITNGGWLSMSGDIDMNDNMINEIEYLTFNTSDNSTTSGRMWFYDGGGSNRYFRGRMDTWNGQFDMSAF